MTRPPLLDPLTLRHTLGAYPTGVALIAAEVQGRTLGMLANSFTSVSLDPPLVSMSFAHTSTTWPTLSQAKRLGISALGAGDAARADLLRRPSTDRFEGIKVHQHEGSAMTLPDAAATFIVERHSEIEAGDHVVAFFAVVDHSRDHQVTPLVFHSGTFHALNA
ncbi:flavin reductase family protein [Nesterenkonia sp. DZ6]|uniref:flavin reductase family protein n=1 Tax=Nesterenkonia sp. DZ6 TaxID=2901229 RepID=UPI001F4CEFA6|nr:flavin reductase family protein [Nesterenkonia sp. DZ6]MCH8560326.1 flavin reductase family protein [Nesterenkonia sp. DZ6]